MTPLDSFPLFAKLPEDDRARVYAAMRRRRFTAGTVVCHEGDPGDSCHVVVEGRFAVSVATRLGDRVVLAIESPGNVFGELALVRDDGLRTATITALEPSVTLELHRREFDEIGAQHPAVSRFLIELLAARVVRLSTSAMSGLFDSVESRVLAQLNLLADLYLSDGAGGPVPVRQEIVAAMAGTTRPTVNRVLKQAELDGLIALRRGQIEVLDRDALRRRAR
ncbi:MAG TPA: Crp/Fnr family transcriptional regulator [Acidimicrobiia bacterium]